MHEKTVTFEEIATATGVVAPEALPEALKGQSINGVCSLEQGRPQQLAFAEGQAKKTAIAETKAGFLVLTADLQEYAQVPTLVVDNPKLVFARIARLFLPKRGNDQIHATAVVADTAVLGEGVTVAAHAVIGERTHINAHSYIGANAVIGDDVVIGEHSFIGPNVTLEDNVRMGKRASIQPNAAIGGRGFGLAHTGTQWEPVPQLGGVVMGNDVEVGASTTIDRGALGDTIIGNDVHIDNQIQIGHNCKIGDHTVIAGSAGIAGSCTIGANCLIGGGVGIGDHLTIVDNVIITAASQVPHSIEQPGVWSSTFRAMPANQWRRLLARFRQLGRLNQRVKQVEKQLTDREHGEFK